MATSALGMGYDKPDLAFCLHLGSPASPVAYYQQVGRAGRALDDATAVLVPSEADERIWDYFATAGIPVEGQVEQILDVLADEPQSLPALESATGIRRGRLETVLKILAVDDAVTRQGSGWVSTGKGWYFDEAKWAALRKVRATEADLMRRYAHGEGCLMQFLQLALDDPDPSPCGRCSVCDGQLPAPGLRPSAPTIEARAPLLPGPGRARRAAEDVGQRTARQEGQDRFPRRGPGDGVRGRSRLVGGAGRSVAAGRRGAAGGAGGRGRGAEALVEDAGSGRPRWWRCRRGATRCWSPRWPPTSPGSAGCRWSRRSPCPGRRRPRTPRRVCGRVICWPGRP